MPPEIVIRKRLIEQAKKELANKRGGVRYMVGNSLFEKKKNGDVVLLRH